MLENRTSTEALRQLQICNACRYCEGYCETFGALGRLPILGQGDVSHLANICHDCRACFQACMFTEPHEFAVNIPLILSAVRVEVYDEYAPLPVLNRLLRRGVSGVVTVTLLLAVAIVASVGGFRDFSALTRTEHGPGAFYALIPSGVMLTAGLIAGLVSAGLILAGQVLYWREAYPGTRPARGARAWLSALRSAAVLAAMRGGADGDGCYYPEAESPSHGRRWMHMLTAYGFLGTFAATCAAAVYQHGLGRTPPYGFWSVPVILGTVGGAMMVVGVSGLLYLKATTEPGLADPRGTRLDYAFLVCLQLLAVTGLLLLVLRGTSLMPLLLSVHLAVVGTFFLTAPYGKMVHAMFRFSALLKDRLDQLPRTTTFSDLPEASQS